MRAANFHSIYAFLFRLWNLGFLCCFFVFFVFRNDIVYILEHAIEYANLEVNYELWDKDLSSEIEIEKEKQEVILSDVFKEHIKGSLSVEELAIKNPIACRFNVLSVYFEVLCPPPWPQPLI